jgi:hypothetical protein
MQHKSVAHLFAVCTLHVISEAPVLLEIKHLTSSFMIANK